MKKLHSAENTQMCDALGSENQSSEPLVKWKNFVKSRSETN